ncbi:MAG: hypothetical protein Q7R85_04745 [bacterium]|nr:hypothetical protein [bacterium]
MIGNRTERILEAVIREFVASGHPVSSDELYEDYSFGIKPASIRAELLRLTHAGFLEQPHTSGGRVPTESGYALWVDELLRDIFGADEAAPSMGKLFGEALDGRLERVVEPLVEELRLLGVGYDARDREVYKSGLDELCERIDFKTREDFLEVVRDFDRLDASLARLAANVSEGKPRVFIGKSPITRSSHLSVVVARYNVAGAPIFLAAIGPKRMDYKRALNVFKELPGGKKTRKQENKKAINQESKKARKQ